MKHIHGCQEENSHVGAVDGSIQEEIHCYVMKSMSVGQNTSSPALFVLVAPSTKGTSTVTLLPSTGTTCLSAISDNLVTIWFWLPVYKCTLVLVLLRLHKICSQFCYSYKFWFSIYMFLSEQCHYCCKFKFLQQYFWLIYEHVSNKRESERMGWIHLSHDKDLYCGLLWT